VPNRTSDAIAGDRLHPEIHLLEKSGRLKLAPTPPPVRVVVERTKALGLGLGFVGSAAQLSVVVVAGGVVSNAFVPTTAQGYTRLRNVLQDTEQFIVPNQDQRGFE